MRSHDLGPAVLARAEQVRKGLEEIKASKAGWIIEDIRVTGVSYSYPPSFTHSHHHSS